MADLRNLHPKVRQRLAEFHKAAPKPEDIVEIKEGQKTLAKIVEGRQGSTTVESGEQRESAEPIRTACEIASWFAEHQEDDETYRLKEGWDLFYIIKSLVILWRRYEAQRDYIKDLESRLQNPK